MTDILRVDPRSPDPHEILTAAARLREGQLVAFPTETVYGLGVHALDRAAVRRLFDAKGRPATDPLIVHVAALDAVSPLVAAIPDIARRLASRFWPGPLTLIMRRSAAIPDEVSAGLSTVAIRIPAHPVALALITAAQVPVAAPSANLFSRPSPTQASHVLDDLSGRIDLIVDGGPTSVGVESTVLDLTGPAPEVLRPGAITLERLAELVPNVRLRAPAVTDGPQQSPGLLPKHYSPKAPLTLYAGDAPAALNRLIGDAALIRAVDKKRIGILATTEDLEALASTTGHVIVDVGSVSDLNGIATRLYARLRELDAAGVDLILSRDFSSDEGIGIAIRDRLTRAAAGRIVRR